MKKLLLLKLLLFTGLSSFAQTTYTATYFQNSGYPGSVRPASSGVTETTGWTEILGTSSTSIAANTWSPNQTLPFTFNFFGQPVTDFKVSANMLLTFDVAATALPNANDNLPSVNLPNNTISVFWDEFTNAAPTGSGDRVMTKVFGTAPNRQLWVVWFSFEYGNPNISFAYNAAVLEETTNNVYLVELYNNGTPALTTTVGVQQNSTTAVQFGNNMLNLAPNTGATVGEVDYYRFMPRPVVATDAGATAFLAPGTTGCYTATQPVEITITNFGTSSISNVPVGARITGVGSPQTITGTYTGTLAPNASANVVIGNANMATPGTYNIKAYSNLANDLFRGNDTLATRTFTVAPVVALPQSVDFTGFTGSNLTTVFPNWKEAAGATMPAGTTSSWSSDNFGNVSSGPNGTGASINLWVSSKREWIVGPKIQATASTVARFDLALTGYNATTSVPMGSDDIFQVMVSTDCGQTFTPIRTFDANTPISNTGQTVTVSLAQYAGQQIIVAFFASEGTVDDPQDNELHIDNIFLGTPPSLDIATTGLVAPGTTGCFTATQPVSVTIENAGPNALNFATNPVTVTVNVTGAATQTLTTTVNTGTLAIGASQNVVVGNLNMTAAGTYTFNATSTLAGDGNPANDALPAVTRTVDAVVATPQTVDFTGFTGSNLTTVFPNWKEASGATLPAGTTSSWTNDDFGNIVSGANGTAAKINLYTTGKNEWIIGPKILATTGTVLKYDLALTAWNGTTAATLGSDDVLKVMVSADCGATWTAVQTFSNNSTISNTGQLETVNLGSYAGQEIIVAFFASEGTVDDTPDNDLFIDNVFLGTPPAIDMAATALVTPAAGACYGAAEVVTVTVQNLGSNPINFATTPTTVTVNVTGAVTQTLTTTINTGTLAPLATQNVNVGTLNMSTVGTYTIAAATAITGDGNPANDNLAPVTLFNGTIATFPYLQDFETFPATGVAAGNQGWTGQTSGLRWETEDGPTASSSTGPDVDHTTGAAGGKYVYLETSTGSTGDVAEFISPCINLTGQTNMSMRFWYHMYGATVDTLKVDVFNGTTWTNAFMIAGQQQASGTDPWQSATISLASYSGSVIKVRFRGKRGTSFTGDIAIDDVSLFQALAAPTVTAGGPTAFCSGGSVTLTAASTVPNATFQWFNNGTAITGATSATYTATAAGSYTVTAVSGPNASAPSAATTVTITPGAATPTVTAGGATTFCTGGSVALTAASATPGATFQWFNNGTAITGATAASYTATAAGSYTVVATATGCPSAASAATTVTVNQLPATPTITQNGNTLTSSAASGNQWFSVSGTTLTPIAGATAATFTPTATGTYTVRVTTSGCQSAAATSVNVTITGVAALAPGMDVSVYPNPTAGKFAVQLKGFEKEANIQIINVTGQVITTEKVSITSDVTSKAFNLNGMAKGVYILKVTSGDNLTFRKVILD